MKRKLQIWRYNGTASENQVFWYIISFHSLSYDWSIACAKRALHRLSHSASCFNYQYPLVSLRSAVAAYVLFLVFPLLLSASLFLGKIWPASLGIPLLLYDGNCYPPWLYVALLFSHDLSNWSSLSFSSITFQNLPGISYLLSEVSNSFLIVKSNLLVKRFFFVLNAAFATVMSDIVSRYDVMATCKQLSTFRRILVTLYSGSRSAWNISRFFEISANKGCGQIYGGSRYAITWVGSVVRSWNSCRLHKVNVTLGTVL
jgi:hypothetical protein